MKTNTEEKQMEDSEVTANCPSDDPERVFEQFSIPAKSVDQFPDMEILTAESSAFRIHVKSN